MDKQTREKLLRIVERNYEDIAEDFHETRKKALWPEIIKLTEEVKDGASILDVGCGNGRLLAAFKDKKINYLGVDKSVKLIELAKEEYAKNFQFSIFDFQFLISDILDLGKIPQINFDYVFCIAVLHHLPGEDLQINVLKQLKNKINANGKIIVTVWNLWTQKKFVKLIFKFWLLKFIGKNKMDFGDILFDWKGIRGESSQRYYHAFRNCELKKIVKKAGLKIEKIYRDKYNFYLILIK